MSKIYTLRVPLTGDASILNGKIFKGKIDPSTKQISFIDVTNNAVLIHTSPIVKLEEVSYGVIITTYLESKFIYDLIDLDTILPTALINNESNTSSNITVDIIRRMDIKKYRFDKQNGMKIFSLQKEYDITNIGELERAIKNNSITDLKMLTDAKDIIKNAGFKITDDSIEFEGFDKFNNTKDCTVIGYRRSFRNAHYCDAWNTEEFIFQEEDVTEEQFKEFCIINNLKIVEPGAWYQSYSKIEYHSDAWIYKWVDPYTD